jgi:hypothetical protein
MATSNHIPQLSIAQAGLSIWRVDRGNLITSHIDLPVQDLRLRPEGRGSSALRF